VTLFFHKPFFVLPKTSRPPTHNKMKEKTLSEKIVGKKEKKIVILCPHCSKDVKLYRLWYEKEVYDLVKALESLNDKINN